MLVFQCVGLLCTFAPPVGEFVADLFRAAWRRVRGPTPTDRFVAAVFEVMRKVRGWGGEGGGGGWGGPTAASHGTARPGGTHAVGAAVHGSAALNLKRDLGAGAAPYSGPRRPSPAAT